MAGKRRYGKRKYARRKPRFSMRGKRTLVNKALQPIAQRYICKMKYSESFNLDTTGSGTGIAVQRMNLNSINDPNRSGTGHKPYGYATLLGTATSFGLYNRYRVISCTYNIYGAPGANQNIQITALPGNESISSGSANASALRENPRARYIAQTTGAPLRLLKGKVYLPSLVGRTKAQYMADDRYQSITLNDPAELAVLNIYLSELADSPGSGVGAVPVQCKLTVEMTYTVEVFDIHSQAQTPAT